MAQDRLLLSDGASHLLLSDGVSVLLLSTSSAGTPPGVDPNPYRRFYPLEAAATYPLEAAATYPLEAAATYPLAAVADYRPDTRRTYRRS